MLSRKSSFVYGFWHKKPIWATLWRFWGILTLFNRDIVVLTPQKNATVPDTCVLRYNSSKLVRRFDP